MAFFHYPYREYIAETQDGSQRKDLRPTLDITVSRAGRSYPRDMLVDTGSPLTIMQHNVGVALDVDFENPDSPLEVVHMFRREFYVQRERVTLGIHSIEGRHWDTDVWFIVDDDVEWSVNVGGVLGGDGFFDHWAVTFVRSKNYFVIEEPESFAQRIPPNIEQIIEEQHDQDWWRIGPN